MIKLSDLLIIYFAVGAPFGVYQFTTDSTPLNAHASLQIFLRICFWPVFAVLVLVDWFGKENESEPSHLDRQIDTIRIELEEIVFANESISSIFDFREILLRYSGLAEAANVNASGDAVNELFALSGSDNKELASACLARKNQRRLEFHQSLVRGEFLDMISEFAEAESGRQRILELAFELASGVNDSVTADSLTRLMSEPRNQSIQSAQSTLPLSRTHSASSSV